LTFTTQCYILKNMNKSIPILYVVVPCYNEEPVLEDTAKKLEEKMNALMADKIIADNSRVMFVDDGSKDKTYEIITALHNQNNLFSGVKLAHNRGHQNALMAGLTIANKTADVTITIDADLQDDINAIDKMLEEYANGAEIVYGVRCARKKDTMFKRMTAHAFYKLMLKMGVEIIYDHADFRLMSKTALDALFQYQESNMFLRGIVPQLGFKTAKVPYPRAERQAGESKYPLPKMIAFALNGITSCSSKPLTMIFWLGFWMQLLGLGALATTITLMYVLNLHFMWVLISAMCWFTSLILLALGIIGFYLGKTYIETKQRPRFIIEEVLNQQN